MVTLKTFKTFPSPPNSFDFGEPITGGKFAQAHESPPQLRYRAVT